MKEAIMALDQECREIWKQYKEAKQQYGLYHENVIMLGYQWDVLNNFRRKLWVKYIDEHYNHR